MSPDPAPLDPTTATGLNRYAYAADAPATRTDPTGQQSEGEADPGEIEEEHERLQEILHPKLVPADPEAGWKPTPILDSLEKSFPAIYPAVAAMDSSSNGIQGTSAIKVSADTIREGRRVSTTRLTGTGEKFIRYESSNPVFTKLTPSGGVKPGTFAAPASDSIVPVADRVSVYNLPSPEILRTNTFTLMPPPGTPVIGPRPVAGGTGNEVVFPYGYQP